MTISQTSDVPSMYRSMVKQFIPEKNDSFVKFGNFNDIKKLFRPVYFIQRLLLDFLAMVKLLVLNKRVLN